MKEKNECLNFFKGIACIFVVSLHVRFPIEAVDGPVQCIARFAVPLFFMISGFYCCYNSESVYLKKLPKKIEHIAKICFISFIFWILMQYAVCFLGAGEHSIAELTGNIFNINSLVRLVLLNDDPVISILWFLLALFYCYLIYYVGAKKRCLNMFPKLIIPLLLVHLMLGNIGNGILRWSIDVELYRNVWLMGFPIFTIGHTIKANQDLILEKVSSNSAMILMLFGTMLSLWEWYIVGGRQQMYIGSIIMAVGSIIYSIWHSERKVISCIAYIGAKLSLYVYVLHISVGIAIEKFAKIIKVNDVFGYQCLKPTIVIISTIIISILLVKVIKNVKHQRCRL